MSKKINVPISQSIILIILYKKKKKTNLSEFDGAIQSYLYLYSKIIFENP